MFNKFIFFQNMYTVNIYSGKLSESQSTSKHSGTYDVAETSETSDADE